MASPETRSPPHQPVTQGKDARQNDQELEKALEDTFPASDPPSQSSPTQTVGWEEPEKEDTENTKKGG
ncbi:hypothetical protein [Teichococcus aestuarii]|uniref:hypothetical protein n=1 Tax=Teichococcus aestuarii TaxID=568898 RepID=UPI0036149324